MWRNKCGFLLYIYGLGVVYVGSGKKNFCHMDTWNARIFIFWEAEMIPSDCLQALKLREPRVAIKCGQGPADMGNTCDVYNGGAYRRRGKLLLVSSYLKKTELRFHKEKKDQFDSYPNRPKEKRTERPLQIINH